MKTFDWPAFLRLHPIFSRLDDRHAALLLREEASTERTYGAGDVIVHEGDVGDSVFLIGSGAVEVMLSAAGGTPSRPHL